MSIADFAEIRHQENLLARAKAERERDALADERNALADERDALLDELEEARDTIETLVEKKRDLNSQIVALRTTIKILKAP